mmetsp:Transcript_6265/g.10201  ORF Transcript_6265/g.10201 Transcript_6265/m.10201 type:complete len:86 (+) Transcript_6265:307-564(+)
MNLLNWVPDLKVKASKTPIPRVGTFINETTDNNGDYNTEFVLTDDIQWYNYVFFFYFFPMFFLIILNDNEDEFNFLQGCHEAWYG